MGEVVCESAGEAVRETAFAGIVCAPVGITCAPPGVVGFVGCLRIGLFGGWGLVG